MHRANNCAHSQCPRHQRSGNATRSQMCARTQKIFPRCKNILPKAHSPMTELKQQSMTPHPTQNTAHERLSLSPHSTAGSSAPSGTKHRLQGSKGWSQSLFCTLNLCQSFFPRNASSHSLAGTARLPQRKGSGRILWGFSVGQNKLWLLRLSEKQ